jgi:hypothetical protein
MMNDADGNPEYVDDMQGRPIPKGYVFRLREGSVSSLEDTDLDRLED